MVNVYGLTCDTITDNIFTLTCDTITDNFYTLTCEIITELLVILSLINSANFYKVI